MGNWHCVPSSCAEVVYQEYLPPVIRWRYPGEQWQEIIGASDYTLGTTEDLSANTLYRFIFRQIEIQDIYDPIARWGQEYDDNYDFQLNGIQSWRLRVDYIGYIFYPIDSRFHTYVYANGFWQSPGFGYRQASFTLEFVSQGVTTQHFLGNTFGLWGVRFQATNPALRKQNCVFKVFKNGQIVHQEARAVCPEVEKLPCRLSPEIKRIEIEKFPYLEKVEVVPYAYSAYKLPGVPAPIVQADQIPAECLNIYNNAIYVIPPSGTGIYPNATPFDSFIAQICSYPGCPPPQYQVLCDSCGCESCPPGTRAVTCGGMVCCYGSDGVSVQEISSSNYCGGGNWE